MRALLKLFCAALLFCVSGYAQNVGDITTVTGTGTGGFSGDGGLSISQWQDLSGFRCWGR